MVDNGKDENCYVCGSTPQYRDAVSGKFVCSKDATFAVISKEHLAKRDNIQFKVRYAKEEELNLLEELEESIIDEHADFDEDMDAYYEKAWADIRLESLVAETNSGEVIGFMEFAKIANPHEMPALLITDQAVIPQYQNMGVSKALLKGVLGVAKENLLTRVYVETSSDNIPAIMFHLKNGADFYKIEKKDPSDKIFGIISNRFGIRGNCSVAFVYNVDKE